MRSIFRKSTKLEKGVWPKKWKLLETYIDNSALQARRGKYLSFELRKTMKKYNNKNVTHFAFDLIYVLLLNSSSITKSIIPMFSRMKRLRRIELIVTNADFSFLPLLKIHRLTSLTILSFTVSMLSNKNVKSFFKQNPSIINLEITNPETSPLYQTLYVTRYLKSLKHLYLSPCSQPTKPIFSQILSKNLTNLETLIINQWNRDPLAREKVNELLEFEDFNDENQHIQVPLQIPYNENSNTVFPFVQKMRNLKVFKTDYHLEDGFPLQNLLINQLEDRNIEYDLRVNLHNNLEFSMVFLDQLKNLDFLGISTTTYYTSGKNCEISLSF